MTFNRYILSKLSILVYNLLGFGKNMRWLQQFFKDIFCFINLILDAMIECFMCLFILYTFTEQHLYFIDVFP